MRRLIAVYSSLALVLALFMAPFQHVHLGVDHDHDEPAVEHHHSNIIHAHFLLVLAPVDEEHGSHVTDVHPPHRATSLDSFATAIPAALTLPFQPASRVILFAPIPRFAPTELLEARGHDPPSLEFSSPRAPPVLP